MHYKNPAQLLRQTIMFIYYGKYITSRWISLITILFIFLHFNFPSVALGKWKRNLHLIIILNDAVSLGSLYQLVISYNFTIKTYYKVMHPVPSCTRSKLHGRSQSITWCGSPEKWKKLISSQFLRDKAKILSKPSPNHNPLQHSI